MHLPTSHNWQQRQKALSARLQQFGDTKTSTQEHIDQRVKIKNLTYGLATTMARLLSVLSFVDRSRSAFQLLLAEFNHQANTSLTYEDFARLGWLRYINREIVIPQVVHQFLWEVNHNEQQGLPSEIPVDKREIIAFLRVLDRHFHQEARLTIEKDKLITFLKQHAHPAIDPSFLVRRKILSEHGRIYRWIGGDYAFQLRNEIAAALWQRRKSKRAKQWAFRHYVNLLIRAGIWPDALHHFLPPTQTAFLSKLAASLLLKEPDLVDLGTEAQVLWLDAPFYANIRLELPRPQAQISGSTSVELLNCIERLRWTLREAMDYQDSRQIYALLLRLTIDYEPTYPRPYQHTQNLLQALNRPFLVWSTFENLHRHAPQAIPYLLEDTDLAPLAFRALAELKLKPFLVSPSDDPNGQYAQLREVQSSIWLELFELVLEAAAADPKSAGEMLGNILYELAVNAFTKLGDGTHHSAAQKANASLYHKALAALAAANSQRMVYIGGVYLYERLIYNALPGICAVLRRVTMPIRHEFIQINLALIDLSIRILQLIHQPRFLQTHPLPLEETTTQQAEHVIQHVSQMIDDYFNTHDILVDRYQATGPELLPAKSGNQYFGAEIIDWGYLFIHFQRIGLLSGLTTRVYGSLRIDRGAAEGKYSEINLREADKLRFYLKILLTGYLSLRENEVTLSIEALPVIATRTWLEQEIERTAAQHSLDDVPQGRFDLFEERHNIFGYDASWVSLTSLLYRCVNLFQSHSRKKFVQQFFQHSLDLGRMLTATNLLESRELQEIIAERIKQISVDDFIKSRFTITDLEDALLAAVNSTAHWQRIAEPLIKRIKLHFKQHKYRHDRADLLFEIELLLAYKLKNKQRLVSLAIPSGAAYTTERSSRLARIKQFFLALHQLYNEKLYADAIRAIEPLAAIETHNTRFAFHLYRARTLQAVHAGTPSESVTSSLYRAQQAWDAFMEKLNAEEKKAASRLSEAIDSTSVHYLALLESSERFDQTLSRLSNPYLYDEELIPVIYANYRRRELPELAFAYLDNATQYYLDNKIPVPTLINELRIQALDFKTIDKLKLLLGSLRNQQAEIIPKILPQVVNGYYSLDEFILREFIQATRVMVDKIQSIEETKTENRYNDLLFALLQLRFAVWGWSIHDQARVGLSGGKKDAGEADLIIKSAGDTIALAEALILRSPAYTVKHILKCHGYVDVPRYYMIVYNRNKKVDFATDWQAYQTTVLNMTYPSDFTINSRGFEIAAANPEADSYLRVASTKHGDKYTMFHIMISLGS